LRIGGKALADGGFDFSSLGRRKRCAAAEELNECFVSRCDCFQIRLLGVQDNGRKGKS
jgi:hypothetical protein